MKKLWIILLVLVMVLVGCEADKSDPGPNQPNDNNANEDIDQPDKDQDSDENEDANDSNHEDSEGEDEAKGDLIKYKDKDIDVSVQEAFNIFKDKYPNAKINEIELEHEDEGYEYEIEGYEGNTQYELKINAHSGDILDDEKEKEDDEHGDIEEADLDKVEKYLKEAFEDAGDGYWLDEYELKSKSDYVKFDIDLKNDDGDKIKYKYNYETGELLEKK